MSLEQVKPLMYMYMCAFEPNLSCTLSHIFVYFQFYAWLQKI